MAPPFPPPQESPEQCRGTLSEEAFSQQAPRQFEASGRERERDGEKFYHGRGRFVEADTYGEATQAPRGILLGHRLRETWKGHTQHWRNQDAQYPTREGHSSDPRSHRPKCLTCEDRETNILKCC